MPPKSLGPAAGSPKPDHIDAERAGILRSVRTCRPVGATAQRRSAEGFGRVRREWQPEELIASWTLVDRDWELVANKTGATRLGFALLLKFFELEGRFPTHAAELPPAAVEYVAGLVKVAASELAQYEWSGRTIEYHRAQIREASGFREPTRADEQRLARWLADEVCPGELGEERQRTALLARCREQRLEPPGRIGRLLGSARRLADERFCARAVARARRPGRGAVGGARRRRRAERGGGWRPGPVRGAAR